MPESFDVLRLRERPRSRELRFGPVEAGFAASGGTVSSGLNAKTTAQIDLITGLLAGQPVDYLAPMEFRSEGRTVFNGIVLDAQPDRERIHLAADSAPELEDRQIVHLQTRVPVPELMHLLATGAGFPENRISIEGLDALPLEAIEVIAPVHGVSLEAPMTFGTIRVVPPALVASAVDTFDDGEAKDGFRDADAYAIGFGVEQRLIDAETAVLSRIDDALAWLTVRARYGLAMMPDERPQHYRRRFARARPRRGALVLVRAMVTGRAWLRSPGDREAPIAIALERTERTWRLPPEDTLSLSNRQAVLACARAAHTDDPVQRVQAIFEAIEFYVASVHIPSRFDKTEARRVRKAVPKDIDSTLRERVMQVLGWVDDPPLKVKLIEAAKRDGAPLEDEELDLLWKLRNVRNDAVHGRDAEMLTRETIDHAVSIVARLLVYRLQPPPRHLSEPH